MMTSKWMIPALATVFFAGVAVGSMTLGVDAQANARVFELRTYTAPEDASMDFSQIVCGSFTSGRRVNRYSSAHETNDLD